jgi:tRNA U34 2-thiouridine synthase MnmA/TrmU
MKDVTAAGFISGGLDSILAVELMKRQYVDIFLVNVINGFGADTMRARADTSMTDDQWKDRKKTGMENRFGLPVEIIDISEEFLATILDPRYGYGKNVNPCIDCKIDFFSIGRRMIDEGRADFIFTGEVLGQRPMSQNNKMMEVIEKRSGLERLIVRPLSGKIMKKTIPEREGWIDREMMTDIQGRSRRRQMALAEEFGITDYPAPAGGCLLTDVNFCRRFKDLLNFTGEDITVKDTVTLSVGRHFRTSENTRVVVGRNEQENNYLENNYSNRWFLKAAEVTGPAVILFGDDSEEELKKAASITARYCNDKESSMIRVTAEKGEEKKEIVTAPAGRESLAGWMI